MTKAQILLVDHKKKAASVVSNLLRKNDYSVHIAYNGVEALEKAHKIKPHLIIMDAKIPLINGYEVCRRLKENEDTSAIPVIMLTKKEENADKQNKGSLQPAGKIKTQLFGYDAGATEFLTKPLKASELLRRIKFILWTDGFGL